MSEKGMKVLCSRGLLPCLKSVEIGLCEDCIFGKQKRVSFSSGGRALRKEKLELIHTDLWGPAPVASMGGAHYYMTFIDDCTRKVWVYFLKSKSDAFDTFRKWKALVENETGLKVKCLRSDNGGEYELSKFKEFTVENGIRMEKTVRGTPQQNGVAERMNRTLNERARSMRLKSGLPKMFWAEAINTAAYLINRGPSSRLDNGIPEEAWSGKKVNLSFLRIFGCTAYAHIADSERSKLDAKSEKGVFVGYGGEEFGYRLWIPNSRKVVRRRDVVFDERTLYKSWEKVPKNCADAIELPEVTHPLQQSLQQDLQESLQQDLQKSLQQDLQEDEQIDDVDSNTSNLGGSSAVPIGVDEAEHQTPEQTQRKSKRNTVPPNRYSPSSYYLLLTDCGEPECFVEASKGIHADKWKEAMNDEMQSLMANETWELAKLPSGKKALQNKWVYRIKEEADGSRRYKARLVVKGFQQKHGIDYTDVFTPVVKMTTIRLVLSMVAAENLDLQQLDVKTAFLHGDLEEEIYMLQPEGYEARCSESLVCRLKKSLYGLKQAPRQWYKKFDGFMHEIDFHRSELDHCCYFKKFDTGYTILLLYVDDMLIAGSSSAEVDRLKKQLSNRFSMKDLGEARQILGMRITRDRKAGRVILSQAEYVRKVLERFSMHDARPVRIPLGSQFALSKKDSPKDQMERDQMKNTPYASAIGSLMYAMVCTRPDIAHAVGVVSRFMGNPGKKHWEAVKWILRYLRGTTDQALCFRGSKVELDGYVDADLGSSDYDDRRSTTGYIFTVGGTAVSWASKLQKVVALSTAEAEYVAVTEASKEMVWLQNFMQELRQDQGSRVLYSDSQSAIYLAKNPAFHSRTKHIELKYHYIRHLLENKVLKLEKIEGSKNPADMLTKAVTLEKLKLCIASAGLGT